MLKDEGINIKKNEFTRTGVVIYEDSFGNTVFCRRESEGDGKSEVFTAKLRFADKDYKTEPLKVSVPVLTGEQGKMLHVDYPEGRSLSEDHAQSGIKMYTFIVQRWIDLLSDIRFLSTDPKIYQRLDKNFTPEVVSQNKYMTISEYEELSEILGAINGN